MKSRCFISLLTFLISVVCAASVALAIQGFEEADVQPRGTYRLKHLHINQDYAIVKLRVVEPIKKVPEKPIGNYNRATLLTIFVNGKGLPVPSKCRIGLLDVNYVRLDSEDGMFRLRIQGGDGSEYYQIALLFSRRDPVKCVDLQQGAEPLLSRKNIDRISKMRKHPK